MVEWHHWDGHQFEQVLGVDGMGVEAWRAAVCGVAKGQT